MYKVELRNSVYINQKRVINMLKSTEIIRKKASRHHATALAAWSVIRSELSKVDIEPRLFGSLAKGGFSTHSEIDMNVKLGDSELSRSAVCRIVDRASPEIDVDLFFEEYFSSSDLETFLVDEDFLMRVPTLRCARRTRVGKRPKDESSGVLVVPRSMRRRFQRAD